ncbi:hypothetical protein D3C84_1145380 [compost metagenome]
MPKGQAATVVFRQSRRQQGLKTLSVGDAGQRVLLGQALQSVFQHTALTHMAQATAQHAGVEMVADQPVADAVGRCERFVFKQQHRWQTATARCRLKCRDRQ